MSEIWSTCQRCIFFKLHTECSVFSNAFAQGLANHSLCKAKHHCTSNRWIHVICDQQLFPNIQEKSVIKQLLKLWVWPLNVTCASIITFEILSVCNVLSSLYVSKWWNLQNNIHMHQPKWYIERNFHHQKCSLTFKYSVFFYRQTCKGRPLGDIFVLFFFLFL